MTILLIDEDAVFRTALAGALQKDGHVVRAYGLPSELPPLDALSEISLAIVEHAPLRQNRLKFVDAFHQAHPETSILLLAGYWSLQLAGEAAARPFVRLVRKPIGYEELLALVRGFGAQFRLQG